MKIRKYVLVGLFFEIFVICLVSIFIVSFFSVSSISHEAFKPLEINLSESLIRNQNIIEIGKNSISEYINYCLGSDYMRPISRECINTSSIGITVIDSLDTAFLMGLTDEYHILKNWVSTSFSCNKNANISTKELFSSILGGLISIYSLTMDPLYIEKIEECMGICLIPFKKAFPHPLFNPKTKKQYDYQFGIGSFIGESSSFLLEMSFISKYYRDSRYFRHINAFLSEINNYVTKVGKINPYIRTKKQLDHFSFMQYHSSLYSNILRYELFNNIKASPVSTFLIESFENKSIKDIFKSNITIEPVFYSSYCQLLPLFALNKVSKKCIYKLYDICRELTIDNLPPIYSIFVDGHLSFIDNGFDFESGILEYHLVKRIPNNENDENQIEDPICEMGLCQISKQDPLLHSDYMPSHSISKWLKYLFLGSSNLDFGAFVFNEMGHFIPIVK